MTGQGWSAADVEAVALELWARRHNLSAEDRLAVDALPAPFRAAFIANEAHRAGRREEALDLATRAIPATVDPSRWRGYLLRLQGAILADLRLTEQAVAANTTAQDNARAVGDVLGLASCLQDLATYPHQPAARIDELLTEAGALAEQTRANGLVDLIDFNRAWYAMENGSQPAPVLAAFADVEARARVTWPDLAAEARACRVRVAASSGDLCLARAIAADLPDEADIEDEETRTAIACARAWVLADEGRVDEAQGTLTRWMPTVTEERRVELLTTLADVLAHAGRYAEAWRAAQQLVEMTRENAHSLGSAQGRALEIWYGTRLAEEATRREQARADELEATLAELQAAHEQIRELSQRDQLTGVHNRGHLMEIGEHVVRGATAQQPVAVALVDVDAFKEINDSYGHRTGDAVLRALGDLARQVLDPGDICARYGGEEFVVMRPAGVRPERDLADDLRTVGRLVGRLDFSRGNEPGPQRVTISGGLVHVPGGTLEGALHAADLLMYAAKRAGGNRLITDTDAPPRH